MLQEELQQDKKDKKDLNVYGSLRVLKTDQDSFRDICKRQKISLSEAFGLIVNNLTKSNVDIKLLQHDSLKPFFLITEGIKEIKNIISKRLDYVVGFMTKNEDDFSKPTLIGINQLLSMAVKEIEIFKPEKKQALNLKSDGDTTDGLFLDKEVKPELSIMEFEKIESDKKQLIIHLNNILNKSTLKKISGKDVFWLEMTPTEIQVIKDYVNNLN